LESEASLVLRDSTKVGSSLKFREKEEKSETRKKSETFNRGTRSRSAETEAFAQL
jgi:hypothetical protein